MAAPLFQTRETPQRSGKPDANQDSRPRPPIEKIEQAAVYTKAFSLAISPDSSTLAAGFTDSSIRMLDARTGEKRVTRDGVPRGIVRVLAFTPDGNTIASVCDDNQLRLWDVASGKYGKALPALGDMERVGLPRSGPIRWRSHRTAACSPSGAAGERTRQE